LNVSATALADPRMHPTSLSGRVLAAGLAPEQVVLELTESVSVPDPSAFARWLTPLRDRGFQLAVDDFGAGFTSLRLLVELGPELLKVDRTLVCGVSRHGRRRAVLESLVSLGRRIGSSVLCEGVESREDLETVRSCGAEYAQGWELAPPAPAEELLESERRRTTPTVASRAALAGTLTERTKLSDVASLEAAPRCEWVPRRPPGTRAHIARPLSQDL
jgi:EAL domain-containing protein (putative c-di-GMP-specific phosphodiesterase class I)